MIDSSSDDRVANNVLRHEYRVLNDKEKAAMKLLKDCGLELMQAIDAFVPRGRECALARTKTEEAVFWAVKGLTK